MLHLQSGRNLNEIDPEAWEIVGSSPNIVSMYRMILLAMVLSIGGMPASYSAERAKVGGICLNQGETKTFKKSALVCKKSGKRLVWKKKSKIRITTVAVPAGTPAPNPSSTTSPAPNPSPTPTNSPVEKQPLRPWANPVTATEVVDASESSFREWAKGQLSSSLQHELIIDPTTPKNRLELLTKVDRLGAQLFSHLLPAKTYTVIGSTEAWVVTQLNILGWQTTQCRDPYMPGVLLCLDGQRIQGYVITSDATYDPSNPGSDGAGLLAHEYFHLVQWGLSNTARQPFVKDGGPNTRDVFPAWFAEGSANFVGWVVAALALDTSYAVGRDTSLRYAPENPPANSNAIKDYEIRTCCGNGTPTYPYVVGQVATEYLVASIGFESFINIWIDYRTSRNFEDSFEKYAGISKETFYERFDAVRTSLGLPSITWRLNGLVNQRIP